MPIELDVFEYLVDEMRQERLIAFVGSASSLAFIDSSTGKQYPGLISTTEFVRRLAKDRSYIEQTDSFPDACSALNSAEGRASLERWLLQAFDKPSITPTPAHNLLSMLPFSGYITTNYDTMLECALSKDGRNPYRLIVDKDISHLRRHNTPVVKYHGCVTRPESIIATRGDYKLLKESKPIISSFLTTQLAHRTLLVVGFSLDDWDFELLISGVQDSMAEHSPKIVVVVRTATTAQKGYWESERNVTVVEADLTAFLRTLIAKSSHPTIDDAVYSEKEDWLKNAFFVSLNRIRTLPSETQVVDAYIDHLKNELDQENVDVDDLQNRAKKAAQLVLSNRPNYVALRRISSSLFDKLNNVSTADEAELIVNALKRERDILALSFEKIGADLIKRSESILVFSQSKRVIQALKGVPQSAQATCQLYVAECRPKSPRPFQDAISICESLNDTQYNITIIPDVAIGNLLERGQVDLVLLGAHAIYTENGTPYAFVNTCGTNLLINTASIKDVPVAILAEEVKFIEMNRVDVVSDVSYDEEEELFAPFKLYGEIVGIEKKVSWTNIGYDLCYLTDNIAVKVPHE